MAACRQTLTLIQTELCVNDNTTSTAMPTVSPVLGIDINTPPSGDAGTGSDRGVDDAPTTTTSSSSSTTEDRTKLILGLVIPLGTLILVGVGVWARQQRRHNAQGVHPFRGLPDDDGSRIADDEETGAAVPTKSVRPNNNNNNNNNKSRQQLQQTRTDEDISETEVMDDAAHSSPTQEPSESQTYDEASSQLNEPLP